MPKESQRRIRFANLQARLKGISELQHRMARLSSVDLKARAADIQRRHIELSHRLLHVTRLLDALESRMASNLGWVRLHCPESCVAFSSN